MPGMIESLMLQPRYLKQSSLMLRFKLNLHVLIIHTLKWQVEQETSSVAVISVWSEVVRPLRESGFSGSVTLYRPVTCPVCFLIYRVLPSVNVRYSLIENIGKINHGCQTPFQLLSVIFVRLIPTSGRAEVLIRLATQRNTPRLLLFF